MEHELEKYTKSIRIAAYTLVLILVIGLAHGGITIYIAFSALDEARQERPETTIREVRFKQVDISSTKRCRHRVFDTVRIIMFGHGKNFG